MVFAKFETLIRIVAFFIIIKVGNVTQVFAKSAIIASGIDIRN